MPERNHEVIISDSVFPDTVTVKLAENGRVRSCRYSRNYVSRELYETTRDAIEAWRKENTELQELVEDMLSCIEIQIAFDRTPEKWMYKEFAGRAKELGIEVDE